MEQIGEYASRSSTVFLKVIAGIETTVRSMKVGGIRRVIILPSQGYQNTSQEPLPPNWIFWVGPFIGDALAALYHQIVIRAIPFKSKT